MCTPYMEFIFPRLAADEAILMVYQWRRTSSIKQNELDVRADNTSCQCSKTHEKRQDMEPIG